MGQLKLKEQHPIFLLGKSHKWRSVVGYSPWGPQESDMTGTFLFGQLGLVRWQWLLESERNKRRGYGERERKDGVGGNQRMTSKQRE